MATNTETVEEVVLQNPTGTKCYTLFVPTSLRIYADTGTSAAIYNYLQRIYPVDETGCKKLLLTQSLQVLADLGLLQTWSAMAKGSGVALGKHATFDQLSQAAYSRDVDDDVLGTLGAVAPNHLTAQEKVRFMEIGVAALPKETESRASTPTQQPEMLPIIKN
ncbi:uncharacterized protein LOC124266698 isoform X1 [Haliotis rubra]|uniref:uncharacterized protein LOC124266698 isoform X1 n=1 Tax=Haliotis rubra TaxID=36100 RepID=UPI001EE56E3A|nr:uncharacterized protein LOC124266698 isoform X1 [Haliotis rubra]